MKTCPSCAKTNQDHYKFCLGCGADLEGSASTPPAEQVPERSHSPKPTLSIGESAGEMARRHRSERGMPFAILGIGLVLIAGGASFFLIWRDIADRPTVSGTIVESVLEETNKGWRAQVRYRYVVNANEHESGKVVWIGGQEELSQKEAKTIVDRYPVGTKVLVYYDLLNPSDAVVDLPQEGGVVILAMLTTGLVLTLFGLVVWIRIRRRHHSEVLTT